MEIPFKTLSDNARIWIYPSDRKLSDNEVIEIKELNIYGEIMANAEVLSAAQEAARDAAAAAGQAKAAASAAGAPQGEGSGIPDQAANGKASDTPHQASNDD